MLHVAASIHNVECKRELVYGVVCTVYRRKVTEAYNRAEIG